MLMRNSQNGGPTRWWASSAAQLRGMRLSAPILLQLFPRLSLRPLMLTGTCSQGVLVETKATRVEAPVVLKGADVCVVNAVPLM
jgi:hypothetical protein